MIEWVLVMSTYMPGTNEVFHNVVPGFETQKKCQEAVKPIALEMAVQEMKLRYEAKNPDSNKNENPASVFGCKKIEK